MLEVFQFPRDTWVKEIEDIKPKLMQTEEPKLLDTSLTQQLPITDEVQEVCFKLNNVVQMESLIYYFIYVSEDR